VVEAVALSEAARELVGVDGSLLEQQALGRTPGGARFFDRLPRPIFGDVAEVDEDVGDEATGAAARDRRRQARGAALLSGQRRRRGVA
jgi:hypothetical protein